MCIIATPRHATPRHATPRHATPELFPEIRITFIRSEVKDSLDYMARAMHLNDPDIASRFVRDDVNPDYIVASDKCYVVLKDCLRLRDYLRRRKNAVFIFLNRECFEPDLNVFDYAFTLNPDLTCGDRIIRNCPYIVPSGSNKLLTNTLTREQARALLAASPKFCNFIYSHPNEPRDSFFSLLSQYKRVDSSGKHLNNTGIQSTRDASDWYSLSIRMKEGYKFSIAMENASYRGYTTEKIISSLQAHTVPIYWGDPAVTDYINPKAFINCHDYATFEEVIERVKEVDADDDLWLDMVTQPWQTEEQRARTLREYGEYNAMIRNIFTQDISEARRRATGIWPDSMRRNFTGRIGMLFPTLMRTRIYIGKLLPAKVKHVIKRLLHLD